MERFRSPHFVLNPTWINIECFVFIDAETVSIVKLNYQFSFFFLPVNSLRDSASSFALAARNTVPKVNFKKDYVQHVKVSNGG